MDDLFNILSSSARIDKSKRQKKKKSKRQREEEEESKEEESVPPPGKAADAVAVVRSRDRTGKRDTSLAKRQQVHKEEIAAFRRSMSIKLSNHHKHDTDIPDPIPAFEDLPCPAWWNNNLSLP